MWSHLVDVSFKAAVLNFVGQPRNWRSNKHLKGFNISGVLGLLDLGQRAIQNLKGNLVT